MSDRILLIEDDGRLAEMVSDYLGQSGFRVSRAANGAAGLQMQGADSYDIVVLDLMLPDMDGLDVCRQLRRRGGMPILMLTARGDAMDRIVGLEMGADDYLPKPFEPRELLARHPGNFAPWPRQSPRASCASVGWRSTAMPARSAWTVSRRR